MHIRTLAALCVAGLLSLAAGSAEAACSLPYIFANGQTADANQVNTNLDSLRDCSNALSSHLQPTITSSGSVNAQTLTYSAAAAYASGDAYAFIVGGGLTNTGPATLNINSLGAKAVQLNGAALVGGELLAGRTAAVWYDGTQFQLATGAGIDLSNLQLPSAAKNIRGLAIDVRNFGAKCDWNGSTGTDDTTALQTALNWSVANPGSAITAQTGAKCLITSTLTVTKPYSALVSLVGAPFTHHDGGTTAAVDSDVSLVWGGAGGGTMMDIEPAAGAGALVGNTVRGIFFDCNGTAAYGLVAKSIRGAIIDVGERECTTAGVLTTTVSAPVVGENLDFLAGTVKVIGYQVAQAGYVLQMTGVSGVGNTDYNDVWVNGSHYNGTGLWIGDADNNRFWGPHIFKVPGGSATYDIDCNGEAGGDVCRSNKFYSLSGAAVFRGTETLATATNNNIVVGTDGTNGSPDPVLGTGVSILLERDNGNSDFGRYVQLTNNIGTEYAVFTAKAAGGGGRRVEILGDDISIGPAASPGLNDLTIGIGGNNTVQVIPNAVNNSGHSFGVGSYAFVDNNVASEAAIFGAATASAGGNRMQLSASQLYIGTDLASPNLTFDAPNGVMTFVTGTPLIDLGAAAGVKMYAYNGGAAARIGFGNNTNEAQFFMPTSNHRSWNAGGDLQPSGTNDLMRLYGTGGLTVGSTADPGGGIINAANGFKSGGVAGVGCTAGVVNATTMTVANGIVTHC